MKYRICLLPTFIFLLSVLAILTGCGRKTMVVPPQSIISVTIENLSVTRDNSGAVLAWIAPQKTTKGDRLTKVASYEVLRAQVSAADYCADCPVIFSPLSTIPGGTVLIGSKPAGILFRDNDLAPDNYYIYKVRSRTGRYALSGDSNKISLPWKIAGDGIKE